MCIRLNVFYYVLHLLFLTLKLHPHRIRFIGFDIVLVKMNRKGEESSEVCFILNLVLNTFFF